MKFMRSASIVGLFTIICRVTGYARDLMLAKFIGANAITDALSIALKIPSFFRRIFAEGAFNVSFLPLFKRSNNDERFASLILSVLLMMIGVCLCGIYTYIFLSDMSIWSCNPVTASLMKEYSCIIMPYVLFISLVAFFGSLLNAHGHFSMVAISNAVGNVFIIMFYMAAKSYYKESLPADHGLYFAWGVFFSGIVQLFLIVISCIRIKCMVWPAIPVWNKTIKKFFQNFGASVLSMGTAQISVLLGIHFMRGLPEGCTSIYHYADRLNQLPLSIVGISLTSVLLPLLSEKERDESHSIQNDALTVVALLGIPISVFIYFFADPICFFLFGGGKLNMVQIQKIAQTVIAFTPGIFICMVLKIFNTRFFASHQPMMPFIGGLIGVLVEWLLLEFLIDSMQQRAVPFSFAISVWFNVAFLAGAMYQKNDLSLTMEWCKNVCKIAVISVVVGILLYVVYPFSYETFAQSGFMNQLLYMCGTVLSMSALTIVLLSYAGVISLEKMKSFIIKKK